MVKKLKNLQNYLLAEGILTDVDTVNEVLLVIVNGYKIRNSESNTITSTMKFDVFDIVDDKGKQIASEYYDYEVAHMIRSKIA